MKELETSSFCFDVFDYERMSPLDVPTYAFGFHSFILHHFFSAPALKSSTDRQKQDMFYLSGIFQKSVNVVTI